MFWWHHNSVISILRVLFQRERNLWLELLRCPTSVLYHFYFWRIKDYLNHNSWFCSVILCDNNTLISKQINIMAITSTELWCHQNINQYERCLVFFVFARADHYTTRGEVLGVYKNRTVRLSVQVMSTHLVRLTYF
jgi:hypothetical protein